MRKYAILKEPIPCNKKDFIYKIMLYQTKKDVESVYEDWNDEIDERGWIDIDDPLPDCQHDAFLPIRVKGREIGEPQWGQLEILKDGQWVDYRPE